MNLGQLFADQIIIKLDPQLHIAKSKLKKYIQQWPNEIYEIIISMQNDERLDHYIYQLPNGEGVLEFNLDINTRLLDISYQNKNHLKFQQKFKKMLNIVYKDIAEDVNYQQKTQFATIDEVDQFFQSM